MLFFYYIVIVLALFSFVFFFTRSLITIYSLFFSESPFVPLVKKLLKEGLSFLELKKGDRFVDIGSGDGRVILHCAKLYPEVEIFKGIEINWILVLVAKFRSIFFRNRNKIFFERSDAFKYDYSSYNKVFMYLLPDFVKDLMPVLEKQLPSGAVVVSVIFRIPEEYKRSGVLTVYKTEFRRKPKEIYIWKKN